MGIMGRIEWGGQEKFWLEEAIVRNPQAQAPAGKNARRGYQSGLMCLSSFVLAARTVAPFGDRGSEVRVSAGPRKRSPSLSKPRSIGAGRVSLVPYPPVNRRAVRKQAR
jgi:hypothetical protein